MSNIVYACKTYDDGAKTFFAIEMLGKYCSGREWCWRNVAQEWVSISTNGRLLEDLWLEVGLERIDNPPEPVNLDLVAA